MNVVAPLALVQAFLPALERGQGRVLHLGVRAMTRTPRGDSNHTRRMPWDHAAGCPKQERCSTAHPLRQTSVAFRPQYGTATYGVSKMAFHRLYEQLNAEGLGIPCASLSPGIVDTEGVRDHVEKSRAHALPHVRFFDEAFERQWTTPMPELMCFVDELIAMEAAEFSSREWRFSEWRKKRTQPQAAMGRIACSVSHTLWRTTRPAQCLGGLCVGAAAMALLAMMRFPLKPLRRS